MGVGIRWNKNYSWDEKKEKKRGPSRDENIFWHGICNLALKDQTHLVKMETSFKKKKTDF